MQYTGMNIRQSVTLVSLASNGFGARGLLRCSLHQVRPQSHLLSLCAQLEYLSSPDAGRELGMVEQGRFFPHGSFSHMDHSDILDKCSISHDKRKISYYTFYLFIYFHVMGQSLVKTDSCTLCLQCAALSRGTE